MIAFLLSIVSAMTMTLAGLFGAQPANATITQRYSSPLICPGDQFISGGDFSPWPWGRESDMPWTEIQGVWAPLNGNCDVMFTISARMTAEGQAVQVHQYNPIECATLGVGASMNTDKVVKMTMFKQSGFQYALTLRNFAITSKLTMISTNKNLVLSLFPKDQWNSRKSYQLQKVAESAKMICYKGARSRKAKF
jgi:hypothetical protein